MASRRRYKIPEYRDGGAVPLTSGVAIPEVVEQSELADADAPSPSPTADDPIRKALEAQRRAEEMQRQYQQASPEERQIASLGISDAKKHWLRQHPEMLQKEHAEIMNQAYGAAIEHGIPDDSQDMFEFLGSTVAQEMVARRERLANAARAATMAQPARPELTVEREVERLNDEASSLNDAYHAKASAPDVLASQPQPQPARQARRSMPMTAPVSRDVPSASGQRLTQRGHLSPEECAIARNSFTDPNMTNAQKEQLYLQNRTKLQRLRQEGLYPERERG